jgi:hypothetical protein
MCGMTVWRFQWCWSLSRQHPGHGRARRAGTYGLLILTSATPNRVEVSHLAALVIIGSMVAHSPTEVLVARWFTGETGDS